MEDSLKAAYKLVTEGKFTDALKVRVMKYMIGTLQVQRRTRSVHERFSVVHDRYIRGSDCTVDETEEGICQDACDS